jgi:hypothetical protein
VVEPDGTDTVVEIEPLSQIDLRSHLHAVGPANGRQAHRAEQDRVCLLDPFERGGRQWISGTEIFAGADRMLDECETDVRDAGFDGAKGLDAFGDNLRSDPVASEHGDLETLAHAVVDIGESMATLGTSAERRRDRQQCGMFEERTTRGRVIMKIRCKRSERAAAPATAKNAARAHPQCDQAVMMRLKAARGDS